MPDANLYLLLLVIILALGFGFTNGLNDAANAIATVVGTRVLSPRNAILMAAVLNFAGAATGLEVAKAIGKGILIPEAMTSFTVIAGLAAAIIWVMLATYRGLPLSVTHSLVAGLAGAGMAVVGSGAIVWNVMERVLASVVTAPVLGFVVGFVLMILLYWVLRRSVPAMVQTFFGKLQIFSAAFMAYAHGKNDGQMPIGVIAMALVIYYQQTGHLGQATTVWDEIAFGNLWWVIIISSLAISLGTAIGGWRVIRTLGIRITTLRPVHGFVAETSGAAVIEMASLAGIPVSTTHCITTAIMGVGSTRRFSAVRWGIGRTIIAAWIITFPITGALGYFFSWLLHHVI